MPQRKRFKAARKRADIIAGFTFGRARTASAAPEPPNLRDAEAGSDDRCGTCKMFNDGECWGYGNWKVEDTQVCDSFTAEPDASGADKEADDEGGDESMAAEAPVDAAGNVDPAHACAACGHEALSHQNTDQGENTGACGVNGCECLAMKVEEQPSESPPEAEEGAGPEKDDGAHTAAGEGEEAEEVEAAEEPAPASEDSNKPPEVEGSDDVGPAFKIPVLIIEGQPTGDGREIELGALDWRTPPLPLMLLATETHDPSGWDLNDPAVLAGRIETLSRGAGEDGTNVITAEGHFLNTEEGRYAAELVEQMGRMGVSGDVAIEESEFEVTDTDEIGIPMGMAEKLTAGTIMGATMCPYAAFEGAYIVLAEAEEAAPEQIEQAVEQPEAVTAGGQLIHWMAYSECEQCNEDVAVVASGGPERPPASWFADPGFEVGDGRTVEILAGHGERRGAYACPLTVTPEGQVYGHIAPWGVCHAGKAGSCITAPRGGSYVHFLRNQNIVTAEGETVSVGVITADTGHAGLRLSPAAAMAHYDDTAFAAAYVTVGEDKHGIWVAGAIAPTATEGQVQKLRAASISGDWRRIAGKMELVAALAVNYPGYPVTPVQAAARGGSVEAMTAAGAVVMGHMKHEQDEERHHFALDDRIDALLPLAKDHARQRLARLNGGTSR